MSIFYQAEQKLAVFMPDFMCPELGTLYDASFLTLGLTTGLKDAPIAPILNTVLQADTDQ